MERVIKLILVCFVCIVLASCDTQYETSKEFSIKSNLASPQEYYIKFISDNEKPNDRIDIKFYQNGKQIEKLFLTKSSSPIKLRVIQKNIELSLFSGVEYKGRVVISSVSDSFKRYEIPVSGFVNPWISTYSWIFYVFLAVLSLLFVINLICYSLLKPVTGVINFIKPRSGPWFLYPPSRVLHCKRNIISIGTGIGDSIPGKIEESQETEQPKDSNRFSKLRENHFQMVFKKSSKDKSNFALVSSKYPFNIKESKLSYEDKVFISENPVDSLLVHGFTEQKKYKVLQGKFYTIVVNKEIFLTLEI